MKQIIDGLTYNTATAERIGDVSNGYGRRDFKFFEGTVYRTQKGRYFIYGEGGAMSIFSHSPRQNEWCGSDGILPLEHDHALSLIERHSDLAADQIAKFFSVADA